MGNWKEIHFPEDMQDFSFAARFWPLPADSRSSNECKMRDVRVKLHPLKLIQGQFQLEQINSLIQGFNLVEDDAASPIQNSPVPVSSIKLLLNSYSLLSPPHHELTSQDKGFLHKGSGSCIQVPAIWSKGRVTIYVL